MRVDAPHQQSGFMGIVTIKTLNVVDEEAERLDAFLKKAKNLPPDVYRRSMQRLEELCTVKQAQYKNLVVTAGREEIMKQLNAESTTALPISYGALGTGTTAVAAGDTTLDTEVIRKGVASRSRSSTTLTIDFYYSKSDWDGTAEEFGTFINGSPTADTGTLFNRVITGGAGEWVKSSTQALTVSIQFDLNAA